MKLRKYFSISVDSTTDVSHIDQLIVIVPYALDGGPIEWFLKFLLLTSHKGKDIADLVLEVQIKVISMSSTFKNNLTIMCRIWVVHVK